VDQQAFEHDLDVARSPEDRLDARPPAAGDDDGEVAGLGVARPFAVERDLHVRHEERLPDEELAALCDLDDEAVGQVGQVRL